MQLVPWSCRYKACKASLRSPTTKCKYAHTNLGYTLFKEMLLVDIFLQNCVVYRSAPSAIPHTIANKNATKGPRRDFELQSSKPEGNKNNWLVVSTPLKNISQLGWLFPIYGKIKNVPVTTNQKCSIPMAVAPPSYNFLHLFGTPHPASCQWSLAMASHGICSWDLMGFDKNMMGCILCIS